MRHRIWTVVLALLALWPVSVALAAGRNVVLMIGDDHGLQVGCYGDRVARTPAMDRLAAQGTRFANAFAGVASCSPSRAVILTGQHTHTNGQYGLAHDVHNFHSFNRVRSLPNLLGRAGYRTAIVGKYHVLPETAYTFDQHLPCPGGPRQVAAVAESARKFMAETGKPFFLLVGYTDPHRAGKGFGNDERYPDIKRIEYKAEEFVVPPWLPDNADVRADLAAYCESISRLDQGIGLMLDAIRDTGHAGDTLVIYVSDNGPPFPGAKTTLYDPGLHLPLLIFAPGQKKQGVVSRAMTSFVDITPTVLEWAGVKAPPEIAGRSLLPILAADDPAGWDVVYGSHTFHEVTMYYPMRMIRTREHKYILNLAHELEFPFASDLWGSLTWQGVLRRKDVQYGRRTVSALLHRPREELYDLRKDPDEIDNLATDPAHASVLQDLRQRLRRWQDETKDPWVVKYRHE